MQGIHRDNLDEDRLHQFVDPDHDQDGDTSWATDYTNDSHHLNLLEEGHHQEQLGGEQALGQEQDHGIGLGLGLETTDPLDDSPKLHEPRPIHHTSSSSSLDLGLLDHQSLLTNQTQAQGRAGQTPHKYAIPRIPSDSAIHSANASSPLSIPLLNPNDWDSSSPDIHNHNRNDSAHSGTTNTSATESGFSSAVTTPADATANGRGIEFATFGQFRSLDQDLSGYPSGRADGGAFGFGFGNPDEGFPGEGQGQGQHNLAVKGSGQNINQAQGTTSSQGHGQSTSGSPAQAGGNTNSGIPGINSFGPTPSPSPYVQAQLQHLFPATHQEGIPFQGQQVQTGSLQGLQQVQQQQNFSSSGWGDFALPLPTQIQQAQLFPQGYKFGSVVPTQGQQQVHSQQQGQGGQFQLQGQDQGQQVQQQRMKFADLGRLSTNTSTINAARGGVATGQGIRQPHHQYRSGSVSSNHSNVSGDTEELADWNDLSGPESSSSAYGNTFANYNGSSEQIVGGLTELNMRSRSSSIASNIDHKAKPYSRHPQTIHQKRSSASLSYVSSPGSSRKPTPAKTYSTRSAVSAAQNAASRPTWNAQEVNSRDEDEEDDDMNGEEASPISPSNIQPSDQAKAILPMPCGEERDAMVDTHLQSVASSLVQSTTNVQRDRGRIDWTNDWLLLSYDRWEKSSVSRQAMHEAYVSACCDFNIKPLNTSTFGKYVREAFPGLPVRRLGNRGNSRYHYCGLRPISMRQATLLNDYSAKHGASNGIYYTLPSHGSILAQPSSGLTFDPSEMLAMSSDEQLIPEPIKRKIKKNSLSLPSLKPTAITTMMLDVKTPTASGRVVSDPRPVPGSRRSTSGSVSSISASSAASECLSSSIHSTYSLHSVAAEDRQSRESTIPDFPNPSFGEFYVFSDMDRPAAWQLWQSLQRNLEKLAKYVQEFSLDTFEKDYCTFWSNLTPQQITICSHSRMSHLLCKADVAFYRNILEFLQNNIVRDVPDAKLNQIVNLGESIERIVCESLPAACDEALFDKKIESAARFGHMTIRFKGLHALSTSLQQVMSSPQTLLGMIGGWSSVAWPRLFDQAALVLDIMPDSIQSRVFGGIAQLLSSAQAHAAQAGPEASGSDNLHSFVTYLRQTMEEFLTMSDGRAHPKPRRILSGFMWLTSEILRDLSLHGNAHMSDFQTMKTFADDYVTLMVLSKSTLETPPIQYFTTASHPDSALSASQSHGQVSAMMPPPTAFLIQPPAYGGGTGSRSNSSSSRSSSRSGADGGSGLGAGSEMSAGMSSYGVGSSTQAHGHGRGQGQGQGPGKLMILPGMTWVNDRQRSASGSAGGSGSGNGNGVGLDLPPVPVLGGESQDITSIWTGSLPDPLVSQGQGQQGGMGLGMGMSLTPMAMTFTVGPKGEIQSGQLGNAQQHQQPLHHHQHQAMLGPPSSGMIQGGQLQGHAILTSLQGGMNIGGMNLGMIYPSQSLTSSSSGFGYSHSTFNPHGLGNHVQNQNQNENQNQGQGGQGDQGPMSGGTNSAVEQMIFTPLASSFGMRSVSAGAGMGGYVQGQSHGQEPGQGHEQGGGMMDGIDRGGDGGNSA